MNGRLLFPVLGSTLLQPTNASQEYSTTTVRARKRGEEDETGNEPCGMGRGGVGRRAAVLLTLFLLFSVRYGLYFSSSPPFPQFFSLLRIDSFGLLFPSTLFFHSNFFSQTRDLPLSRILCGSLYFLSFFSISRVLQFPVFLHYVVKIFNFPTHTRNNRQPYPS